MFPYDCAFCVYVLSVLLCSCGVVCVCVCCCVVGVVVLVCLCYLIVSLIRERRQLMADGVRTKSMVYEKNKTESWLSILYEAYREDRYEDERTTG